MKKIVIIGANEFQNRLILKAKDMGLETHVFAWECGDIGEKNADFFYPISITEKEKILKKCKEINPDAIVSIASDLAVITVNYVASALGLNCNESKNSLLFTNKYEMRKAFKSVGLYTPNFMKINNVKDLKNIKYPLIVKPTDRSGSRAISLVNNFEELDNAVKKAVSVSFEKYAIVEEVIEGNEYSCECISYHGKHECLTITKKYTTGFPKCIETGHIQPCDLTDEQKEDVKKVVYKALDSLKIKNGASHTEFKISANGEICLIETGARMGGDCIGSDLVYISTGYDYMKMVIDVALDRKPDMKRYHKPKIAVIKFIFSEDEANILKKLSNKYPKNTYYISEIADFKHEIIDSSSRYGFYIFEFDTKEEFEKKFERIL